MTYLDGRQSQCNLLGDQLFARRPESERDLGRLQGTTTVDEPYFRASVSTCIPPWSLCLGVVGSVKAALATLSE